MFGLDITFPAFMSIVALIFLIAISCVNEKINVGFLGIGLGLLVGGLLRIFLVIKLLVCLLPVLLCCWPA